MKGAGSRTYYVPNISFEPQQTLQAESDSHHLALDSHHPAQDSHQLLVTIPPNLQDRIPAPGSKPRRTVVRTLLIDLCGWQAMSARELAAILRRQDHKPLVRDYLSPMVDEGLLAYTIPEMENHPDQRYTLPNAAATLKPTRPETP